MTALASASRRVTHQRLRTRMPPLALVGRALVVLFALALLWYGLMTMLLAFKASPHFINGISGYRSVFNALARLHPHHIAGGTRAITAAAGLLAFIVFLLIARQAVPRPYLARRSLRLANEGPGALVVAPHAVERIAEVAARECGLDARGRYTIDELGADVTVAKASTAPRELRTLRERLVEAVERHELPIEPVNVTLVRFERQR